MKRTVSTMEKLTYTNVNGYLSRWSNLASMVFFAEII